MSSFGSLSTALSALYAQRRGLDVTAQNVANASTPGYTRQRVDMSALGPPSVPAVWSTYGGAGSGVAVTGTSRLRDTYLEARGQVEHARLATLTAGQATLTGVEDALGEPGDTGLQAQLATYWAQWHDVANNPGDLAARSQLIQQAGTIATTFHGVASALSAQWDAQREQLGTLAAQVSTIAGQVADLNLAIVRATQAGTPAAELADQRDLLVMTLADLAGVTTRTAADGAVDVYLGGTALVRGSASISLTVAGPGDFASRGDPPAPVQLVTTEGHHPLAVTGGQAGGMLESLTVTIPTMLAGLDTVAAGLVDTVNTLHATGYDLDGAAGGAFFDPAGRTAATLTVAVSDPRAVAASGVAPGVDPDTGALIPNLDGSLAAVLAEQADTPGSPDEVYRQLVADLGVAGQTARARAATQQQVTDSVDAAREAQAGVNLDEEMVAMVAFQQAYAAAARVLTAIDETLDVLINQTGLVGR